MLKGLIEKARNIRGFEEQLYLRTPLMDGREVRRVGRLLRYDADAAREMIDSLPFEPRSTYPARAVAWAKERRAADGE